MDKFMGEIAVIVILGILIGTMGFFYVVGTHELLKMEERRIKIEYFRMRISNGERIAELERFDDSTGLMINID